MEEVLEAIILGGGDDDDIEYAILDNILIDRDEVGGQQGRGQPAFDLDALNDEEVLNNFRFHRRDLPRLQRVLRIPAVVVTDAGDRVDGSKALLIMLKRLAYPVRLWDMKKFFNMSSQSLSQIIRTTCNIVIQERGNLLEDLNSLQWLNHERMVAYAEAIHNKGAPIPNCWGFIDGTPRAICRPSIQQQEYYSGHKKYHCLKYQSVLCPDGIISSLIGAYPGRRHDAAIFRESNLYEQLQTKAVFGPNTKFVLYGDQGYGLSDLLITPFAGAPENMPAHHVRFSQAMKALRVTVEWGFSKIISLFAFVDFKKNQKLLLQDIETVYKVAVLLTNAHTCLYGHEASQYFNINPPQLEEYFGEQF